MIDIIRLRKVCLSMLFVAFFLWLHFFVRFWIVGSTYDGVFCNPVGPFGVALPQWFIIGVSVVIVASIFSIVWKYVNLHFQWPWLLILSGGLGNLLERIFFGCIMDYIHISFFPVFNVSDILLTMGTIGFIVRWNRNGKKNQESGITNENF